MLECRYVGTILMEVGGKVNRKAGTDERQTGSEVMARSAEYKLHPCSNIKSLGILSREEQHGQR